MCKGQLGPGIPIVMLRDTADNSEVVPAFVIFARYLKMTDILFVQDSYTFKGHYAET